MAQCVFADLAARAGVGALFAVDSRATSTEEIGNPPHPGTVAKLREQGIPLIPHRAQQLTMSDYKRWDLIIGMDGANVRTILRLTGGDPDGKVHRLLEYAGASRDIADPWYTGDFDQTYADVAAGCAALLAALAPRAETAGAHNFR